MQTPPATSSQSGRTSRLLPSVTDLLFLLLLIAFTFGPLAPRLLWDADIGWHIRNGQDILATHTIPRTDSFSATMSGHPWYAWEWLYDVLVAAIFNHFDLNGVALFSALIISLILALVFRLAQKRGARLPITFVFFALCTVASSIHFLARPHIVGWLLTVMWFWILDSTQRNSISNHHLFWLPPLMLLWTNLHGGFVLGFVLLGIFLVADVINSLGAGLQRIRARSHAQGLVLVFVLSAAATFINPYGRHLHAHVFGYLTNRFLMQHIDEFHAPDLHGLPAQFFLLMLLATLAVFAALRFRLRAIEWLLILFSAASGLYAARNIPVSSMLLTMTVPLLFSRITILRETSLPGRSARMEWLRTLATRMTRLEFNLRGHLWPLVLVALTTWIAFHNGTFLGRQYLDAHFDEQRFPVQAVSATIQRGNREPIFSLDSWGGYLIYRLHPHVKVFVDDRHDFYGEPFLRDYLKVLHVEPGWETVFDNLHVNLVLMPVKSKAAGTLRLSREWRVSYEDKTAIVLERKGKR